MTLAILSPQLYTGYNGRDYRAFQPNLLKRVAKSLSTPDGENGGFTIYSDFRAFGASAAVSSNVGRYSDEGGQYRTFESNSDAIAQVATDRNGVVTFTLAATDNNESSMQPGAAASVMGLISDTAGDDKLLVFDTRIKVGTLAECGVFAGMSEEGLAADATLADDTGALADKDFIGFHAPMHASECVLDFVWKKAGQTAVELIASVHTLVADTYVSLGFVYDPKAENSKKISVFVNNAEQTTFGTATQIAAATFPDGEELNPLWLVKTGAGAAKTLSLDSFLFHQGG